MTPRGRRGARNPIDASYDGRDADQPASERTDVGAELEQVCRSAAREVRLLGAAVSLMSSTGSEAVAAVSDATVRRLEQIRFDTAEGPARDAFVAGRPVLTPDMQAAFATWPAYAPAAVEAGIGSAFAFPLQLGASRFGVLTLYDARARTLDTTEQTACLTFADVATEALLDDHDRSGWRAIQLPSSLRFRSEVHQAQGMVMVDLGIGLADALARMRAHAFATSTDLDQLALDILAGRTRLATDEP